MARVLVPLAEDCEELEAVTVIDLLRRAGIEVISAGLKAGPVKASRGVVLIPDRELDDVMDETFDMLVLPGGLPGADHLDRDPRIQRLVKDMAAAGAFVAAICAAPKVLVTAGLLEGKRATAYPGILESLAGPAIRITAGAVVCDGRVITSRGPGTAMDFALELIRQLAGDDKLQQVETALVRQALD